VRMTTLPSSTVRAGLGGVAHPQAASEAGQGNLCASALFAHSHGHFAEQWDAPTEYTGKGRKYQPLQAQAGGTRAPRTPRAACRRRR